MSLAVANAISGQIGARAMLMMGAKHILGDADSLRFRIQGCVEINLVKVRLNGRDLYDVEFMKVRGLAFRVVATCQDVYAEDLNHTIETKTGLRLSL